jgi:DNA-binding beta-propeller fold protein YncE
MNRSMFRLAPLTPWIFIVGLLANTGLAASHPPEMHGTDAHVQSYVPGDTVLVTHAIRLGQGDHQYESVPDWARLPDSGHLGSTHGGVVVDRHGFVYTNTDTERSVIVFRPDGTFDRAFGKDHVGIHHMQIVTEGDEQFIYATHLAGDAVVKFTLDGKVIWTLPVPKLSGKYDDNAAAYNPTSVAVAPTGDVFVADGYGRNWVHQFDRDRNYKRSFGGPGTEPGQFQTCHGLGIDTRGETPTLVVCDRENRRLQRFSLDGEFIEIIAKELRRPCAVAFWGDLMAVAELEGRVVLIDPSGTLVSRLGDNPDSTQWANHGVPPEAWKHGVFTAPHGIAFDAAGNLYVQDWNASGRLSKLVRLADAPGRKETEN